MKYTGVTVRITTVTDLTGVVEMTTTAAATTATTLAVTTGIPVMDVTKETGVISPTDLPILKDCRKNTTTSTTGQADKNPGTCFKCGQVGHLQKDCRKKTPRGTTGRADKKPGLSGRVFAITEGKAANTS
nr:hypothetical protein [Tanacetum cinerariifolium]